MSHIFGNPKMSNTSISKNLTGNTLTAFKGCITNDICPTIPENEDLIRTVSEISQSTTLTEKSSGHIIHAMNNDVVITLPLATESKGVYYIFILPVDTTSAKWIVSGTDKIYGPLISGDKMIKINATQIEMGTKYGNTEGGSPGDKVIFNCNGIVWFVDGISQLDSFQFPPFSLTVSSSMIEASGVLSDQNKVINQTQNVNIRETSTFKSKFLGAAFTGYDFSVVSESLIVVIDGTPSTHTITFNCDTIGNTASYLTTLIPEATITIVYGTRLKIVSDTQGAQSTIAITASGSGNNALKLFGSINSGTGTISWNWNSTNAYNLGGFTPTNLQFIQFGLDPSDTAVSLANSNDGTTWNGRIPAFIDKNAINYTDTSNLRVIDLYPFKTIIDNNLDNALPPIASASQIIDSSCRLDSITVYFKTGNDSNGGRAPDMDTNLKYGRMTAPENLWIEFHDDAYNSIPTPTSKQYGKGASLSNLQALYATKNDLHFSMVEPEDLSYSPLYAFAIGNGTSFSGAITQLPVSQYWHAGAGTIGGTTSLSDIETKPGWNTNQPSHGGYTTFELTYGTQSTTAIGKSFVYTGNNQNLSGIYGASRSSGGLSTKLWDETKSLIEQPSSDRDKNVSLVSDTSSFAYPGNPISFRNGNVGRNMNIPDPNWVKVTIDNIPTTATKVRIFQDRYTGGGTPAHDNYAIGSIKCSFSGTYNAS